MPGLVSLLISSIIGYFFFRCLKPRDISFDLKDVFLMIGLGLGISTQIVFYSLLFFNHIDPVIIIFLHLILALIFFFHIRIKLHNRMFIFTGSLRHILIILWVLFIVALIAVIMAQMQPYGDWDGWAYWNFHANFLFKAGRGWHRLFEFNIQAHHPWFLPLLIIWGWCHYGTVNNFVPLGIAVVFTILTVGLLITALQKRVPFIWAAIAGLYLTSIPYFVWHGASQYADIEQAFFVLLCCILSVDLFECPTLENAVLAGLSIAIMASIKENGISAACLMMFLIIVRLFKKGLSIYVKPLIWSFLSVIISVLLMKSFEVYRSSSHSYDLNFSYLWDVHRWLIIAKSFFRVFISFNWGGLWVLAPVIFILLRDRIRKSDFDFMIQFITIYIVFNFIIFVLSVLDLKWLLGTAGTLDRLLYLLTPTVIYLMFSTVGKREL